MNVSVRIYVYLHIRPVKCLGTAFVLFLIGLFGFFTVEFWELIKYSKY